MRAYLLSILFCVVLAPVAFAFQQSTDGGGTDDCGDIDPSQPCYVTGGGTSYTYCTKPAGCPLCGEDANTGNTVCFVVYAQPFGYCTCKPSGRYTNKFGQTGPRCQTSGSCRASR